MKRALLFILGGMITLNGVLGALIFLDIKVLRWPETTLNINLVGLNSEEAIMRSSLEISNPNPYSLIVDNLGFIVYSIKGKEIASLKMKGGEISSYENKTFSSITPIALEREIKVLKSKIFGTFGIKFLGIITKTLPFEINVITNMEILENISSPRFNVSVEYGEITKDYLEFKTKVLVHNPNPFEIYVYNLTLEMENEKEEKLGEFTIPGGKIKDSSVFYGKGKILIKALDAEKLLIKLEGNAGAIVAGINKSIPLYHIVEVSLPSIKDFLQSNKPLDLAIKADSRLTLNGIVINFTLQASNPTKLAISMDNILVHCYRVKDDEKILYLEAPIKGGEIPPGETVFFSGRKEIPFSAMKIFLGVPDWYFLKVSANISIAGFKESMRASVGVYLDWHHLF